jgi:phospholipase D1/2
VGETVCPIKHPLSEDEGRLGAPANSKEGSKVAEHTQTQSLTNRNAEESGSGARSDLKKSPSRVWTLPTPRPLVDPCCFEDPVVDSFWKDIWMASAVRNVRVQTLPFFYELSTIADLD